MTFHNCVHDWSKNMYVLYYYYYYICTMYYSKKILFYGLHHTSDMKISMQFLNKNENKLYLKYSSLKK